jgi:hypothetical protein
MSSILTTQKTQEQSLSFPKKGIVITLKDTSECVNLKKSLISKGFRDAAPDGIQDGEGLIVVAHDTEFGNGSELLKYLQKYDALMAKYKVLLVVCHAASQTNGSDLETPAELVASTLKRQVIAADSIVVAKYKFDEDKVTISGDFKLVEPGSDINSLMGGLNISGKPAEASSSSSSSSSSKG